MRQLINNMRYFFKEAMTLIRLNWISNFFSLISTGLIFFIFAMIISGWWMSNHVVAAIQGEAEVSVYYDEGIGDSDVSGIVEEIRLVKGVQETRVVNKDEAYTRMVGILGEDARVLEFFDENPFSPFIEVGINLEEMDAILHGLQSIDFIDHVRDNREILDRIDNIARLMMTLGFLVVVAVGICTLVIVSHIIRMGVYNNRDQINTLRLLGAPELFIAVPFLLEGLLLTIGGGILASVLVTFVLEHIYFQLNGPFPFIPLPLRGSLNLNLTLLIVSLSFALGLAGSVLGLTTSKSK